MNTVTLDKGFTSVSSMLCASSGLLKQAEQLINQFRYGDEMVYIKPLKGVGTDKAIILRHKHGAMVQARVIMYQQGEGEYIALFCFQRDDQYDLAVAASRNLMRQLVAVTA